MLLQHGHGLLTEARQDASVTESRRDIPRPPEGPLNIVPDCAGATVAGDAVAGGSHTFTVADIEVRRDVQRGVQAEVRVEAAIGRPALERFRAVEVGPALEPKVPLTHHCRRVPTLLEKRSQRCLVRLDEGALGPGAHPVFIAEGVASGQQAVAGRRAPRAGGVRVGKAASLRSQAVDVRGRDFRLRVEAGDVPVTEIVSHDEDDVRALVRGGLVGGRLRRRRRGLQQ